MRRPTIRTEEPGTGQRVLMRAQYVLSPPKVGWEPNLSEPKTEFRVVEVSRSTCLSPTGSAWPFPIPDLRAFERACFFANHETHRTRSPAHQREYRVAYFSGDRSIVESTDGAGLVADLLLVKVTAVPGGPIQLVRGCC